MGDTQNPIAQFRITGQVGPGEITCTTEWLDEEDGDPQGVLMGFRMRGWAQTEVEWKGEGGQ